MAEQRIQSRRAAAAAAHSGRKKLRRTVSIIRGFSMHDSMWTLPSYELPRELACEDLDEEEWSQLEVAGLAEHNRLRGLHRACPLQLSRRLCQMAAGLAQTAAGGGNFRHSERELRQFHRGVHAGEAIAYRVATRWGGLDEAGLLTGVEAARMWYSECADPGYNFDLAQPQDGTGHFTQLVWRATRLMGLASATVVNHQASSPDHRDCPTTVTNVIVALYFPPGNVDKCFEENVLPSEAAAAAAVESADTTDDDDINRVQPPCSLLDPAAAESGTETIVTPKNLLTHPDVFGCLDRGCSLTKLLYVKSLPGDDTKVALQMALFANRNFTQALNWLVARAKEEGQFGVGKKLRITGVGGERYREEIEDKMKMEVEMVHEFVCQQTGAHFLVNNFDDDAFCYQEDLVPPTPPELPDFILKLRHRAEEHFGPDDGKRFPAIFGFCGSGISFNKLNADLSTQVLGVTTHGGKSFLGMAKLIVGTNDYGELMRLAERGARGNVDTQVGEMFALGEKSEYHQLPPEMPLFPFGKASESEDCNYTKEDLAASVIGSFACGLMPQIAAYAKMNRIRRVYIGGHLFSGKPARDIFNSVMMVSVGMSALKIRFLSNGHTGCIGAMLVSEQEASERRANMSLG